MCVLESEYLQYYGTQMIAMASLLYLNQVTITLFSTSLRKYKKTFIQHQKHKTTNHLSQFWFNYFLKNLHHRAECIVYVRLLLKRNKTRETLATRRTDSIGCDICLSCVVPWWAKRLMQTRLNQTDLVYALSFYIDLLLFYWSKQRPFAFIVLITFITIPLVLT